MKLTNKLVIDASRKSQCMWFINHSCDRNCIAEKWNAGGDPRVGITTNRPVKKKEELTFEYEAMAIGDDEVRCLCRA